MDHLNDYMQWDDNVINGSSVMPVSGIGGIACRLLQPLNIFDIFSRLLQPLNMPPSISDFSSEGDIKCFKCVAA